MKLPFIKKLGLSLVASLTMLLATQVAEAQIGAGSLTLSIDNVTAMNGYSDGGTGASITPGTTLTGGVGVQGVSGNGGATTVYCYSNGSQIFSWSTTQNGQETFSWTPSVAGTYTLYCSGTWSGNFANGTVDTPNITIPVAAPSGVQGFVNPKYLVVGVTYAPPGPSSNVTYTGTTSVGSTTTIANSFSNKVGFSVSVKSSTGISGFGPKGSVTVTSSTDLTQGSSSSTTDTISKLTTLSYKTNGTGNAFSPVDSDYDTIWLWLNPVAVLTYTAAAGSNPASLQWNGYGFDVNDPSGTQQPDVYPVLVGWLNGHFGSSPSINTILARGWASSSNGYTWASGQGPGLTGVGSPTAGTDAANIIAADPLTSSSYTLLNSHPSTTSDGRFTLLGPPNDPNPVPYEQAGPGNGGGTTAIYNTGQTNTQSVATGTSTQTTQEFSTEEVFSGSAWLAGVSLTLKQSDTLTFNNSWLNTLTTTTSITDGLSVTGPNCPAAPPGPCNPVYSGPGQFLIYQDNQYGTFLFYPSN